MTVLKHWRDIPLIDPRVETVVDALIQESKSLTDSPQTWRAAQIAVAALADHDHQMTVDALREEFGDWIASHPNAGLFDWNIAAENILRAIRPTEKRDDKIDPCRDETE